MIQKWSDDEGGCDSEIFRRLSFRYGPSMRMVVIQRWSVDEGG